MHKEKRDMSPDVQSFLIENRTAILSFLQNISNQQSIRMPRNRSLTRSMSRSLSPLRGKKNMSSRSRSRSFSRSPERHRSHGRRSGSCSDSRTPPHSARRYYSIHRSPNGRNDYNGMKSHSPQRRDRGDVYRNKRYRDGRDNAEPCRCIGIFGMSLTTTERDLSKIFGEFGDIEQVKVIRDHFTGKSRGFGFIYFSRTREAGKAKSAMTDAVIDGMKVRVDFSVTNGAPGYQGHAGKISRRSRSPMRSERY